jgi:hypothetical protein
MKYLNDCIDEVVLKRQIERALPYLEENLEEGLFVETLIPASAGVHMPYDFLDLFGVSLGEDLGKYINGEYDIYLKVDEVMDEINEELKEVEMLKNDYPYLNFIVGWHEEGIGLLAYPIS